MPKGQKRESKLDMISDASGSTGPKTVHWVFFNRKYNRSGKGLLLETFVMHNS